MKPLLQLRAVTKSFYGVRVLKDVDFDLQRGEIHALLGENGAGKSTLIKLVSGAHKLDSGSIIFSGKPVSRDYGPKIAEDLGITTIYQNFHLIPHLSVAENMALRQFTENPYSLINWRQVRSQAAQSLERFGFAIDPDAKVKNLSVAKKQMVEIAIALSKNASVLIMDEPTAALSKRETDILFEIILELKKREIGVIYVSHKLEEIKQIADRVTILRDGRKIETVRLADTGLDEIIHLMIGRHLPGKDRRSARKQKQIVFAVDQIKNASLAKPITFALQENEILGITGLIGSGKTELGRSLFGADKLEQGMIFLNGKQVKIRSPHDAVRLGIGYLPEDRDSQALCLSLSVQENLTLVSLAQQRRISFSTASEKMLSRKQIRMLSIRGRGTSQRVKYLSGGNKQKVALGKWFSARCSVLILDEPTAGIDIGARAEIYGLVREFADRPGAAVIFLSSDIPEIEEISDRILVLSKHAIVAELNPAQTSRHEITRYSVNLPGE
jgi:ribose transport system ATP-binding protein